MPGYDDFDLDIRRDTSDEVIVSPRCDITLTTTYVTILATCLQACGGSQQNCSSFTTHC